MPQWVVTRDSLEIGRDRPLTLAWCAINSTRSEAAMIPVQGSTRTARITEPGAGARSQSNCDAGAYPGAAEGGVAPLQALL
jgi:hypothetical protein